MAAPPRYRKAAALAAVVLATGLGGCWLRANQVEARFSRTVAALGADFHGGLTPPFGFYSEHYVGFPPSRGAWTDEEVTRFVTAADPLWDKTITVQAPGDQLTPAQIGMMLRPTSVRSVRTAGGWWSRDGRRAVKYRAVD
ncbi:hypothetical protein [Alienimonas sp. DA493]|uniref:hypothetical protein n=1 Tax=Alienimonas sp. DA493 TaxID=3373605 RepID=UPI00375486FA